MKTNIDLKALFDTIVAPNSSASSRATLEMLKKNGYPVRIQEVKNNA
jgi:hypothetical protein